MTEHEKPFTGPGHVRRRWRRPGSTDEEEIEAAKAANRFDIRRLIGGLFTLYALILIALGLFGSHHVKTKAAGINIDLYTGIGMLDLRRADDLLGAVQARRARARGDARRGLRTDPEGPRDLRRQWVSITRSMRPYSTASSGLKKRSRSMSACTRSSVCPVWNA